MDAAPLFSKQTSDRSIVFNRAGRLPERATSKIGPKRSRLDKHDLYTKGLKFLAQSVGHSLHGEFAGRIESIASLSRSSGHGRDIDDVTSFARSHSWEHGLRQMK